MAQQLSSKSVTSFRSEASKSTLCLSATKVCKPAPSLMNNRLIYRIIVDSVDCTPDNIVDPDYSTMDESLTHAAFENKQRARSEGALKLSNSKSKSFADTGMKVYATTISLDDIYIDHTSNTEEGFTSDEVILDKAPSAFYLPKIYPIMSYPPEIFIVLKETNTCFLFSFSSFSYDKGTFEANAVEEDNEFYQYITVGKGKNRKMVTEETQTKEYVTQSRHTNAVRRQKKNAAAFASVWDMHDTYSRLACVKEEEKPDEMVMYQSAAPKLLRKKNPVLESVIGKKGKSWHDISQTPEFLNAVLLTERVLATDEYSNAQKKFRGLIKLDPLSLELVYIYTMNPLWTLECEDTKNRPIVNISFNPKNKNILAVGYGKFTYAEYQTGLVCVWCTKNPCKPERLYNFQDPLTSLSFSDKTPNWLACGFANGDVLILDITSYEVKTVAQSTRDTNPCFEPIWTANWRSIDKENQYVITTCQDGRINKFTSTKTHDFICTPLMRISTVEGNLKGLNAPKLCIKEDVPIIRYPAALCMKWHPKIEHIYIVGTDEGCVHKCSTHYLNQHMDVFRAHAGPVYNLQYSPFMYHLLATCGADNAIRLWIEGIDEMILTLNCPAAVYDIAFCPVNSTILISTSGNVLSIWDLRRKTHMPCAEYTFPGQTILTFVKFTTSGDNVFVGDTFGRVHTFHLEDTPIPPFNQRKLLDETIKKAICTRPQLLRQLEKLEKYREKYSK